MSLYIEALVLRTSLVFFLLIFLTRADLNIITKTHWGGKEAISELTPFEHPVSKVAICHKASRLCNTQEACSEQLRIIQEYQMKFKLFDDIGYNFLIGNDGNVYEGRGWDHQGAFARGFNADTLAIAFIGNFGTTTPTGEALQAAQELIEEGLQLDKVAPNFKLLGHRQLIDTESPGKALYNIINQWPHWQQHLQ